MLKKKIDILCYREMIFYFRSVELKKLQHGNHMLQQAEIWNMGTRDIPFNKTSVKIYF